MLKDVVELIKRRDYDAAKRLLSRIEPKTYYVYRLLGFCFFEEGDFERALELFFKERELKKSCENSVFIALTYLFLDEEKEATHYLKDALVRDRKKTKALLADFFSHTIAPELSPEERSFVFSKIERL